MYHVQIDSETTIRQNGRNVRYYAGEWVSVGRQKALWLIAEGKGRMAENIELDSEHLTFCVPDDSVTIVTPFNPSPSVVVAPTELPSKKTVFFDGSYDYQDKKTLGLVNNPAILSLFVDLLGEYDVVLILYSFELTVLDTKAELDVTKDVVFDLRIPTYQNCAVGIADTKNGQQFFAEWQNQQQFGTKHALLRALFITSCRAYYCPPHWGKGA